MDPKKQNLSPELKEVYDRVMNTTARPQGAQNTTPTPTTPPQNQTPTVPTTVSTTTVTTSPTPPTPHETINTTTTLGGIAAPTPMTTPTTTTPPTSTSFVFTGNKMTSEGKTTSTTDKKKLPAFVIPLGVVILVIAWAAIWAKVFGLF